MKYICNQEKRGFKRGGKGSKTIKRPIANVTSHIHMICVTGTRELARSIIHISFCEVLSLCDQLFEFYCVRPEFNIHLIRHLILYNCLS